MVDRLAVDLSREGRDAYLHAFWELEQGYDWSDNELALVNGVGFFFSQDEYAGPPDVIAMGYLAAQLEQWRSPELAEHRISTIWRDEIEADMASSFNEEWDIPEWTRIVYCVIHFTNAFPEFCIDREHVDQRLTLIADAVGDKMSDGGLPDEIRPTWHAYVRTGVGLFLYWTWRDLMFELNVPEHERWTSNALARPVSDMLVSYDFPMTVRGCAVTREDLVGGYEIKSAGKLAGSHWLRFRALGDIAQIVVIVNEGPLGTRSVRFPEPRHVDVLRDLGFATMVRPDGRRYSLDDGRGVRRLKD